MSRVETDEALPAPYRPEAGDAGARLGQIAGLEKYFQENVIGGPGAFTIVAESHGAFGRSLTKKLIQEIAGFPRNDLAAGD